MLMISMRFSRSSISSRFSQKPWLRSRPSRGYAKVSCEDSNGPITRAANWRTVSRLARVLGGLTTDIQMERLMPVIPALAEILDEYRRSMGNPKAGMNFHFGNSVLSK